MQHYDAPDYTPEDRIITLKSIYGGGPKTFVQPCQSKFTGTLLGVKMYSDEERKTVSYSVTRDTTRELSHNCQFNLRMVRDRADWEWVKHCPMIAMTEQEARDHSNTYTFFVSDEEKEVNSRLERADLEYKAMGYVMETPLEKLTDKALLLNEKLERLDPKQIKQTLLGYIKDKDIKKLLKVIAIYEDTSSNYKLLLYKLLQRNIVTRHQDVYKFGDLTLGVGEAQTVAYLKAPENQDIHTALVIRCYPEVATNPEIRKAFLLDFDQTKNEQAEETSEKAAPKKTTIRKSTK